VRRRTLGKPARRLRAVVVAVVAVLAVLCARLLQVQGMDTSVYTKAAETQRMLATDLDARLVFVDPTVKDANPAVIGAKIGPLLGMTAAQVVTLIQQAPKGSRYVVLKHLVDIPTAAKIMNFDLAGVNDSVETQRSHPNGSVGAQTVGITDSTGVDGLSGVELAENAVLSGHNGKETDETDPSGRIIPQATNNQQPPVNGRTVRLTLDRDLQWEAQTALDSAVSASKARGGDIIVEDPKSGDILAMASAPGFDPSKPVTGSNSLKIGPIQDEYEPGSVNKVITAAAALEEHKVTPTTNISVPPVLSWPGRPSLIHDAENHPQENLSFTGVLAESSNIGTDLVAEKLGIPTLYSYLRAFGLGSTTGLGLAGETSGDLPNGADWNPAQASTIPWGQGVAVTALQMAQVYATIANDGIRPAPHLIAAIANADGSMAPVARAAGTRVVSPQTAKTLAHMLEAVTGESGTAPEAEIPGYRIAGKTGTAQGLTNGRYDGGYVASFIGFAPADAPRLLVEVVIDHPTVGSHFGGVLAAPVFKQVMSFALQEFAIPPTGTKAAKQVLCYAPTTCPQ
jgi:cell division protein FtsI (penicillin-binding protein 3)